MGLITTKTHITIKQYDLVDEVWKDYKPLFKYFPDEVLHLNNSKLGAKNVIWGIVAQIITIGIGILIPRLVLVNLGSEANGLLSSVNSILSYLGLLEAGVGTATVQALYKPYAENDRESINGILSATHHFYRRTGIYYLAIVLVVSVCYTAFVKTGLPQHYVFLVVILSGLSGVLSYFFQGKYRLFLLVTGKGYVLTNITTIITVCVSLTKVAVLLAGGNIVMVQSAYFVYNLIQVIFFVSYMKKHYSWINIHVEPNFKAISQKNAVFIQEISSLVFYHTDTLILTVFASLKFVSVYSMYAMIFGMVKSIAIIFTDSSLFALGQAYSDRQRFIKMHNAYESFSIGLTFSLYCITFILIIPFMRLYTGGVTDINYIDPIVALLFLIYYLMDSGRKSCGIVINFAQHFEQTKWHSIIEASINLVVSISLTAKFGIYGVLFGTIAALLYRANDIIIYAAKLLNRSPLVTYCRWVRNLVILIIFILLSRLIPMRIESYAAFFVWGIGLSAVIIPSFIVMNGLFEPDSIQYVVNVLKSIFSKR